MIDSRVSLRARRPVVHIALVLGICAVVASFGWWLASSTWTTLNGVRVSCSVNAYHLVPSDPGPAPHPLWDACEKSHQPHGVAMAVLAVVGCVTALLAGYAMTRLPRKVWTAPPGWPAGPPGWQPAIGWVPPPDWPPPPADWQWWQRPQTVEKTGARAMQK